MRVNLTPEQWVAYRDTELAALEPIFTELGFSLDEGQLHIGGERYLMSGKKLVLTARAANGARVVIKASSAKEGREEIAHEKKARDVLKSLSFANTTLTAPPELYYTDHGPFTILVTEFIEQDKVFNARTIEEQFFLALRALESQEGFHATTLAHEKSIKDVFPIWHGKEYLESFSAFQKITQDTPEIESLMKKAKAFLASHEVTIERYAPYLTHTDLIPNNMRIDGHLLFIIDYSAFHFGNKYESWARFLNYAAVHSPALEHLLVEYVLKNRSVDEYLCLRLMRIYKIGFLLDYYVRALSKTAGALHALTKARIAFWSNMLDSVLKDTALTEDAVTKYVTTRNSLRSNEEAARQKEFSVT